MLLRARNRIDAELGRTARRAELAQAPEYDGKKSMASWLRGHCRLAAGESAQVVRNGRTLEQLPAVAEACADGAITADQLSVLAPVARPENLAAAAAQGIDVAEVDRVLAEVAATRPMPSSPRWCSTTWLGWTPTGTSPTPPRAAA